MSSRKKSLFVVSLFLIALTAINYIQISSHARSAIGPQNLTHESQGAGASLRSPAAIAPKNLLLQPMMVDEVAEVEKFEMQLKLKCHDLLEVLRSQTAFHTARVSAKNVILHFSKCKNPDQIVQKMTLTNKTNGYNANLFKINKFDLNSDFIQLSLGENELEFVFSLTTGQKRTQVLKINRIH